MEPLDDRELNQLLRQWQAPDTPGNLRLRLRAREPWWRWLLTGTIRVPVPVGLAAVAALIAFLAYSTDPRISRSVATRPAPEQPAVSLADFRPVDEAEVRVVGEMK